MIFRSLVVASIVSIFFAGTAHAQAKKPATDPAPAPLPAPAAPAPSPPAESPAPDTQAQEAPQTAEAPTPKPARRASPAPEAPVDAPVKTGFDAKEGPIMGFMIQGRLAQSLTPVSLSGSSNGLLSTVFSASNMPAASIGYRFDRAAFGVGPTLAHYEYDTNGGQTYGLTLVGAALHLEIDMLQSVDRKNEAYFLGGVTLMVPSISRPSTGGSSSSSSSSSSDDGLTGKLAYGLVAGIGARHWITRNLGIHIELGEGYTSAPIGRVASSTDSYAASNGSPIDARAYMVTTFGTLGITIVL